MVCKPVGAQQQHFVAFDAEYIAHCRFVHAERAQDNIAVRVIGCLRTGYFALVDKVLDKGMIL